MPELPSDKHGWPVISFRPWSLHQSLSRLRSAAKARARAKAKANPNPDPEAKEKVKDLKNKSKSRGGKRTSPNPKPQVRQPTSPSFPTEAQASRSSDEPDAKRRFTTCYRCGKPGHFASQCPDMARSSKRPREEHPSAANVEFVNSAADNEEVPWTDHDQWDWSGADSWDSGWDWNTEPDGWDQWPEEMSKGGL